MILQNVNIINVGTRNISIDGGRITAVYKGGEQPEHPGQVQVHFENAIAFPGLINSHDHLDFNLFPQLGNSKYKNYLYWGNDIHSNNKDAIQEVLKIPKALRTQWGLYKNLLNGVTTVVQHGEKLAVNNAPINIFNRCHSLHSVGLEKGWKYKLNKPFVHPYPFVIHIGEGTDSTSAKEIDQLLQWNLLKRELIGIHGVAMTKEQAQRFKALVWCPDSNFFLLGATAAIDKVKTATHILFGTDSTVSADWNIWQQLRDARATGLLTDPELIAAISSVPAAVWKLNNTGAITEGYSADIVVAEQKNTTGNIADTFFACDPEDILLVLNKGNMILFDTSLLSQLTNIPIQNYSKVFINNRCKYVAGDLPSLIKEIRKYAPGTNFPVGLNK